MMNQARRALFAAALCASGCSLDWKPLQPLATDADGGETSSMMSSGVSGDCDCPEHASCTSSDSSECACDSGWLMGDDGCLDRDECSDDPTICGGSASCQNVPGSYNCEFKSGYQLTGDKTCTDVDECAADNGGCSVNATCQNMPGSRSCSCKAGFDDMS